jgi:hypothetical protein
VIPPGITVKRQNRRDQYDHNDRNRDEQPKVEDGPAFQTLTDQSPDRPPLR